MAREIKVALLGDTKSLQRAFSNAGSSGSKFSGGMNKVGHGLATVVKGAALAGAAVVGLGVIIGTKLVQDMASQQKVSVQTNTVIASTGQAANVTRKHVEDLATAIQNKSGLDDQAVQSGENMLLTFTNIRNEAGKGNKVFDQATKTLMDMSTALGQDASKSAIQLGKALNDPVKGMSALQRVGVTFTEAQKKQVAAMVKAGNTIGAQKLILKELNKEFGGSAVAMGKTLPGKINILKGRLMDLGTSMAAGIMPKLSSFVGFLSKIIAAPNMSVRMKIIWEGIKEFAGNVAKVVGDALFGSSHIVRIGHTQSKVVVDPGLIAGFKSGMQDAIAGIDWSGIGQIIHRGIVKATGEESKGGDWKKVAASDAVHLQSAFNEKQEQVSRGVGQIVGRWISEGVSKAFETIKTLNASKILAGAKALAGLVVLSLETTFGAVVGTIVGLVEGILGVKFRGSVRELIKSIPGVIISAGRGWASAAFDAAMTLPKAIVKAATSVFNAGVRLAQRIASGIKTAPGKLVGLAGDLTKKIGDAISQVVGWARDKAVAIGTAIADGVRSGIQNYAWNTAKSIFSTSVLDLIDAGKKAAQSKSPSKKTRDEIGIPLAQGIILGFLDGSRDLPEKISSKIKGSLESARVRVDGLRASFATSFGRLGADAMSAFDATTTKKLDVIAKKFEKWRDKAAKDLAGVMSSIDASQRALTPSEQAIQDLQAGRDQAGRNADLAKGQADFAAATTPEEQAAAQKEIDDAVYNQRIFDLGVLASAERAKKDAEAEADRQRAQAAFDQQNLDWDAQQARETLDRQSQRDLRKRQLEDMLLDVQANLEKHPKAWRKAHAKIMKIFEEEFGPDFKTAGSDLGTGFRQSLIEDFKVTGAILGNVGAAIRNALSPETVAAVGAAAKPKKMAAGGIVTSPTFALIGESGPEAVIPLSRSGINAGGGTNVYVTVQGWVGDDQAIAEKIRNALIRTGRNTTGGALGRFA